MTATVPRLSAETIYEGAVRAGVCVRPILRRLTDTTTGETSVIPIACGATRANVCPTCAEANRRLRIHQCREGWHLTTEPASDDEGDQADNEQDGDLLDDPDDSDEDQEEGRPRRKRSTRRRADVPDLPRLPVASTTLGRTFTDETTGRTFRPSMFLTLTLGSYGRVRDDGAPVDPGSYDYRRAALDALHLSKLFDRFIQNLRRAVGYQVQYFAVLEPQRRLAPHLHVAIRGTMPRRLLKQVIAATYASVWWPPHDTPVYDEDRRPVWEHGTERYVDPDTKQALPSWGQALDALDDKPDPAHVVRFGAQSDMQGLLAGTDSCDRRVGYLTKYLTKAVGDPLTGDDQEDESLARRAHATRLVDELRLLPCSPRCANWLAYGIQPKDAAAGLVPGLCTEKHHDRDHLGCGGRRVLVSRKWTGKTLDDHRADRRAAVLDVLQAAGADLPEDADSHSATVLGPDGQPRYQWEPLDPDQTSSYLNVISRMIAERTRWRSEYERARDGTRPPFGNSATGISSEGGQ